MLQCTCGWAWLNCGSSTACSLHSVTACSGRGPVLTGSALAHAHAHRRSPVTGTQLCGYGLAFVGVMYYNYKKVEQMKQASLAAQKAPEKQPLISNAENGNGVPNGKSSE